MADDALRRIDTVIQVGLRIAAAAPSGQLLLARIAAMLDPDWLPRPWGDRMWAQLEAARDRSAEPVAPAKVERILRDAWDARPTDELDEFEPEPVAVTPGAQVHRGVLDGAPVAVKVLRPGLAPAVRRDLALLEGLLGPLGAAFPALDTTAVMTEFRERVLDELDLEHEALAQRRFHRALRGHPFLVVPAPITRLATGSVLVSEWIDGVPLTRAADPDRAAAQLVRFVLGAVHAGFVHADPDPNDVLELPGGRLAILDFGATRALDAGRVALAAGALDAFIARDAESLGAAVGQLGALPDGHGGALLELGAHALGPLGEPAPSRLDSAAVIAARDRLLERPELLSELILAGRMPPEDLWPARGVAQLFGTIARVGATGAWPELARTAMREGF